MGRGPRQRLAPAGTLPAVLDDRRRSAAHPRPRIDLRARHGHAQPDALPARERRARVRRRHGAVVVGPRRQPRPRQRRRPTSRMQQATVNLFADMGVAAGYAAGRPRRRDGVDRRDAADLADHRRRPTARTLPSGSPVTITGTAADAGGGVVGGVEVSIDGGTTWHRATGRATWTYTWTPRRAGTRSIRSRAVDDSGNIETPVRGRHGHGPGVRRPARARSGPTRSRRPTWIRQRSPARSSSASSSARTSPASSPAIRFYKGSQNTGTHVGHLWTTGGTPARRPRRSPARPRSGWQQVTLRLAGRDHREHDLRRVVLTPTSATTRPTATTSRPRVDNGAAARPGRRRRRPERRLRLRRERRSRPTTFNTTNYWVDVVFATAGGAGHDAADGRLGHSPANGAPARRRHVQRDGDVQRADRRRDGRRPSTFELRDAANALVPATVTYDAGDAHGDARPRPRRSRTRHDLHRDADRGGDRASRTPPATRSRPTSSWSFTTAGPPPPPPDEGPGGPILVDRRGIESVQPLLRRDPARRGPERVRRDGHRRRHARPTLDELRRRRSSARCR